MKAFIIILFVLLMSGYSYAGGGPEYYEQRQQALNTAYVQQVAPQAVQEMQTMQAVNLDIKEPDIGDRAYVWLRTFVSGWIIMGIFVFGAITILAHQNRKNIKKWLKGVLAD